MASHVESWWKVAALQFRALALGLSTAVFLVTIYTFLSAWTAARSAHVDGSQLLAPLYAQVEFAAALSAVYGAIIVVISAPFWLLLVRNGRDNVAAATIVGLTAPLALWVFINLNGHTAATDLLASGLPYGICGAAAGVVTWWANPRKQPRS